MSCVRPLEAFRGDGGRIVFDRAKSLTRIAFQLPCGRCIGCRLEKARQWGIRCLHEKRMHADSCYLTLTYSDEFLPEGGTLMKRDLQLFFKRLGKRVRKATGHGIRYFAGGEYGETNLRPHYHILLFGWAFPDRVYLTRNKRGESLSTSKELSELWFQGHHSIGEVTFDSAVYCAKYALKKVSGDPAQAHYEMIDEHGVVHQREPEFALMSRRPGVAAGYYEKFGDEVRNLDSVVVNGREVRPPRFYDSRSDTIDPKLLGRHKRARKRLAVAGKADNTPDRLAVKERLMVIASEKKERKL